MSLYALQKLIYVLNREPAAQERFKVDLAGLLDGCELTAEERGAVEAHDVGLLYVLGVNGQLLMHFSALIGQAWPDYIAAMREGVARHGPVRAGVYVMTLDASERVAGV